MRSLLEHLRLPRECVDAMMVTPLNSSVGVMTVYPFNRKNVEALIDATVLCGYYMIGTLSTVNRGRLLKPRLDFRICYFGRSDDNSYPLRRRICDHLAKGGSREERHVYDSSLYFAAWRCSSSDVACECESSDYDMLFNSFGDRRTGNGYTSDPSCSHDMESLKAGNMPLPGMVYVDNENRPKAM